VFSVHPGPFHPPGYSKRDPPSRIWTLKMIH
jgi:hypothetical protein